MDSQEWIVSVLYLQQLTLLISDAEYGAGKTKSIFLV
jgi:hypothetical protein